jgi:hypothetical protein
VIHWQETNSVLSVDLKRFWLTFAIGVNLFLSIFSGFALAQATPPKIPLNPDFTFPGKDTPQGVEVNSASLVENANAWNGRVITFKGEVIGEAMVRGKMVWIHLNDDAYMWKNIEEEAKLDGYNSGHAVWISTDLAMGIRFFGDFKHEGDVVKIVGMFHAACPQHGGDMDIHASTLEIVRVGHPVHHVFNTSRAITAAVLLVLALVLYRFRIIIRSRYAF